MIRLGETPNIGPNVRADLEGAGIGTLEALRAVGGERAWDLFARTNLCA